MKTLKVASAEELLQADLAGVTEIQAMDMCLDQLPNDFFLSATSLEILYLKSSWRETGLPAIPSTVKELFCCNFGNRSGGYGGGGRSSYTPPPKPERRPFVPELPPPSPEDPSQPVRIEEGGKFYNWDPKSQEWKREMVSIENLPEGLVKFYASEVEIPGVLDFSKFTKMEELILNQCAVEKIATWPPNVRLIYANWNKLESVPEFPSSMEIIELNDNQLTTLPAIVHTQLQVLRVDKNKLKSIPQMPETLVELRAEQNQLESLPKTIPVVMLRLYVRRNCLTALPAMAHGQLEELFCGFNKLTMLPQLPVTVELLYCHDNRLRDLGELHEGLLETYCGYNRLANHPDLPESCTEFNGAGNEFGEQKVYVAQVHMLRYQMDSGLVRKDRAFA